MSYGNDDPAVKLLFKLLLVFITAIVGIYLLSPALSIFKIMPSTGFALADVFMFVVIPICAVFFLIYRIFKIFSM
jgi:hypothetical protein